MYKGLPNTTYIDAAVATFDGECYFTKDLRMSNSMSRTQQGNDLGIKCGDLVKWLHHHVKPEDLVVMKMDVEKAEFELLPALLKRQESEDRAPRRRADARVPPRGDLGPASSHIWGLPRDVPLAAGSWHLDA